MFSKIRLILLNTICLGVLLTLGKLLLDPTTSKRPFADFQLPDVIPLAGWELVDSQPLINQVSATAHYDRVNAGRQYNYRQKTTFLDVELRYVLNTNGDVMQLLQQTSVKPTSEIKQFHATSGFYNSFATPERLHLTSCVNPRGNSTVTSTQFFHNRYGYDFQATRLIDWASGQENLIDQRCLWLHLSTPLHDHYDQTLFTLEQVWQTLTIWGQAHFPQP